MLYDVNRFYMVVFCFHCLTDFKLFAYLENTISNCYLMTFKLLYFIFICNDPLLRDFL